MSGRYTDKDAFLDIFSRAWKKAQYLRFGQFVAQFLEPNDGFGTLFYREDAAWLDLFKSAIKPDMLSIETMETLRSKNVLLQVRNVELSLRCDTLERQICKLRSKIPRITNIDDIEEISRWALIDVSADEID